jgi:hypothetical protein
LREFCDIGENLNNFRDFFRKREVFGDLRKRFFKNGNVFCDKKIEENFPQLKKLSRKWKKVFSFQPYTGAVYSNSPLKLRGQSVERDLRTGDSCITTVI